ncbi:NAD-dependent epimerase/dehydratase family protein [Amylibacter sp.]|nr:NAD-dependent epimerase/dehydratase family protein [Amylibacter sp.]
MNIVFGGAGFIGANLAHRLKKLDESVLVFDDMSLGKKTNVDFLSANEIMIGDINKLHDMDQLSLQIEALPSEDVTVWHLAANSDIVSGVGDSEVDFVKTFLTTRNILNFMKKHRFKRIFFASTSAVYGDKGDALIKETSSNLHPISNYGAYKLASEAIISSAREDFLHEALIFRFPNVVGTPATHGVLLDFIEKLKDNKNKLNVLGDGTQQKSYLYVEDLISAMLLCTSAKHFERLPVFNIGNIDNGTSVKEIAQSVVTHVSPGACISYGVEPRGWKGDIPKFCYDVTKIQQLGWVPKYSSIEAINKTITKILAND